MDSHFTEAVLLSDEQISSNRLKYFRRLDGITYLDHAGATLYSDLQLERFTADITGSVYGNPHSGSDSSIRSTELIGQVRSRVLQHFNTTPKDYTVIFTSNCTSALRLVAESFQFDAQTPVDIDSALNSQKSGATSTAYVEQNDGTGHDKSSFEYKDCASQLVTCKSDAVARNAKNCCGTTAANGPSVELANNDESIPDVGVRCNDDVGLPFGTDLRNTWQLMTADCDASGRRHGVFAYLDDNHTSVLGMRNDVQQRGALLCCMTCDTVKNYFQLENARINGQRDCSFDAGKCANLSGRHHQVNNLFAFPAQSNFSGCRYPLKWINDFKSLHDTNKWFVLLDAASLLTTSALDLQKWHPDFVTLSFYKMFGFPTGLGALLVRNSSSYVLSKRYFGGGTVEVSLAHENYQVYRKDLSSRFEDGTLPFLEILAVSHGFDTLQMVAGSMNAIASRTFHLAQYVYRYLSQLCHDNGQHVAVLYHEAESFSSPDSQGPIVNFNLLRPDGTFIGFAQVERLASLYGIHLRTGCFCNMGACQRHLRLTSQQIRRNHESGHVCGDSMDLIDGQPTGSIRVSFGFSSTIKDVETFIKFVSECFCKPVRADDYPSRSTYLHREECSIASSFGDTRSESVILSGVCIYPVKSCAAVELSRCVIGARGFVHDRTFMIATENGVCVSQKRLSKTCKIKPRIDESVNVLTLSHPDMQTITVSLNHSALPTEDVAGLLCTGKVCGDKIQSVDCGDEVAQWLQSALGVSGLRLLRQSTDDERHSRKQQSPDIGDTSSLSLANEAQYLLVATASIDAVLTAMRQHDSEPGTQSQSQLITAEELIERFRPNLIVKTSRPFEEETWTTVKIGSELFRNQGLCSRCQMICIDQKTGSRTVEPLRSLTAWPQRKCTFGILLEHLPQKSETLNLCAHLQVGDVVSPLSFRQTDSSH